MQQEWQIKMCEKKDRIVNKNLIEKKPIQSSLWFSHLNNEQLNVTLF